MAEAQAHQRALGYTPEHDALHTEGELANAACVYAMTDDMLDHLNDHWGNDQYLNFWPFELSALKKDKTGDIQKRIKDLAKAGGFLASEIDRLQSIEVNKSK